MVNMKTEITKYRGNLTKNGFTLLMIQTHLCIIFECMYRNISYQASKHCISNILHVPENHGYIRRALSLEPSMCKHIWQFNY